jgi:23S rRNA (uracil1939-C5)-methyltransferase
VGLFALSLAPFVAEVVGIEEWAPAIEDARRSARLNGVANAAFETGTVEHILQSQARSFDSVVLDPPRRGCAPEVLETLARLSPRRIVYVSCHPGTLARDCKQLVAAGFRITNAEVIDMFPHTHHIESIVRLQRDT